MSFSKILNRLLMLIASMITLTTFGVSTATAQLTSVDLSPDIAVTLGGVVFYDNEVAVDDLSAAPPTFATFGNIPSSASVDAYHLLPNGDELFSLDTPVALTGGIMADAADVIRYDGAAYS